jgi:hypothetical protein
MSATNNPYLSAQLKTKNRKKGYLEMRVNGDVENSRVKGGGGYTHPKTTSDGMLGTL